MKNRCGGRKRGRELEIEGFGLRSSFCSLGDKVWGMERGVSW